MDKELAMGQQTGVGWDKDAKTNAAEQGATIDKPAGGAGSGQAGGGSGGGVY